MIRYRCYCLGTACSSCKHWGVSTPNFTIFLRVYCWFTVTRVSECSGRYEWLLWMDQNHFSAVDTQEFDIPSCSSFEQHLSTCEASFSPQVILIVWVPFLLNSAAAVEAPDHELTHECTQCSQNRERTYQVRLFVPVCWTKCISHRQEHVHAAC